MTREEAKDLFDKYDGSVSNYKILDEIYDDFELLEEQLKLEEEINSTQSRLIKSAEKRGANKATKEFNLRTCESCKLFRELDKACFLNSYNAYVRPSSIDFSGCGKWEAR